MQGVKLSLFVTPLWKFKIDNSKFLNKKILVDSLDLLENNWDFLNLPGEGIHELKNLIYDAIYQIFEENNWTNQNFEIRSRLNNIKPNEYDTPHHHDIADIVGIYYVQTSDNCGDLQLLDSRGTVNAIWQDNLTKTDGDFRSSRSFIKINPVAGLLLIFPSYLIHAVEPNFSNNNRISVVFEIKFT